jgi:phasin family protein
MADEADKATESAEKAYAAAAAETLAPKPAPAAEPAPAPPPIESAVKAPAKAEVKAAAKPAPAKPVPQKPVIAQTPAPKKAAPAKPAAKPAPAKKAPAKAAKPAPKKLPKKIPSKKTTQTKETIMATKTPDFMKSMTDAMSEMQSKAKEAYDKGTAMTGEATEFAKGNVEAMVEASKIFAEGLQSIGKTYADEAKSAFETATADMKEMAAVKSPTELFQLQGKLARRNFDSLVAFGSKSSEAFVKLANEGFAPISGRVSLAADKLSKAA